MAIALRLPDIGEGIAEAEIVEWLVNEGDLVSEHQPLVRVETDKALVEIPSPAAGRIGRIRHQPGDTVHVGEILVSLLAEGESEKQPAGGASESATVVGVLDQEPVDLPPQAPGRSAAVSQQVLATPTVRRLARELGVQIEAVLGSGTGGRVTEADVREHAAAHALTAPRSPGEDAYGAVERIALRGIRRTIAHRLKRAVSQAVLVTHMDDVDITALVAHLQPRQAGTFAWVIKATARTLQRHPRFNATFDDVHDELLVKQYIHIGIAVDTADGLMVPVIRHADRKRVDEIAAEVERLAAVCRTRGVDIQGLRGATFSISNIGALGGVYATPIPNYPEVAILATGRITERLGRAEDGSIVSRHVLPVSLSFDHRVVDGADAARFTRTLEEILREPKQLQ